VFTNGTSGLREICPSADVLASMLICAISTRSDLYVLTQEEKSLPTMARVMAELPLENGKGRQLFPFIRDCSFQVLVWFFAVVAI
jgi:hypothetical protein